MTVVMSLDLFTLQQQDMIFASGTQESKAHEAGNPASGLPPRMPYTGLAKRAAPKAQVFAPGIMSSVTLIESRPSTVEGSKNELMASDGILSESSSLQTSLVLIKSVSANEMEQVSEFLIALGPRRSAAGGDSTYSLCCPATSVFHPTE